MKYSLKQFFKIIDQKKNKLEFYEANTGGLGIDYYIDLITYFDPTNEYDIINGHYINIIEAHYECEKIKNLDKDLKQIDVNGILIYVYIPHVEEFEIFRVKDIKEAERFMCSNLGLLDVYYTGDIIILEDGKRKKFFIKDFKGNILTWYDRHMLQDEDSGEILFIIEWEN